MLLYSFPALVTPFPAKAFNIKGAAINVKNLPSFSFPPIMTHFPVITFINEEVTGCINKEAIGAINEAVMNAIMAPRNPPSCFIFCVLLFQSHHQLIELFFL